MNTRPAFVSPVLHALAVGMAAGSSSAQVFTILTPTAPTYDNMRVVGVSGDGRFAIGNMGSNTLLRATRWTADNSVHVELGLLTGRPYSYGRFLSQTGAIAAAEGQDGSFLPQMFQWTAPSARVTVPFMTGGTYTYAAGLSSDGTVIGGWGTITGGVQRLCRWTSAGGVQIVPLPAGISASVSAIADQQYTRALSGNGRFIIGNTVNNSPLNVGFIYDNATGISTNIGQMQAGNVPRLTAISNDGLTVIGYSTFVYPDLVSAQAGFIWTAAGGFVNLGYLAANRFCLPRYLSGDGRTVLGTSPAGVNFIWTAATGMQDFATFLTARGVDIQGMINLTFGGISDDGNTICGMGNTSGGQFRGWILTLPAPPCYANCDTSTVAPFLTANDFQCFLNKFAAGCS